MEDSILIVLGGLAISFILTFIFIQTTYIADEIDKINNQNIENCITINNLQYCRKD